jgi:DNA-binding Lrp family transcriptional regulator
MLRANGEKSTVIDRVDRQLLRALQVDGRAPFSRLAVVLGSSEQTIARRYRKLTAAGVVRVLVLPAARPGLDWYVRIGVRPGAAAKLADALARRDDVSFVSITSGGAEVLCSSQPDSREQRDALLLERLPRTNFVSTLEAHAILKVFAGSSLNHWSSFGDPLSAAQQEALRSDSPRGTGADDEPVAEIETRDRPILELVRDHGRASYAELAAAVGTSSGRAGRRFEALLASGALRVNVDLSSDLLGFPTRAVLWLSTAPSELDAVGRQVAALPATGFVAAVTGPANLAATVICRNMAELYSYVSDEIGGIKAIQGAEISPILRRVKQAGSVARGVRLPVSS